jgi:hypothetical protein
LFFNILIISVLISSLIVTNGQANKNPVPIYIYPAFNVRDNIMVIVEESTNLKICDLTNLTVFHTTNDCSKANIELIGSEIIYPYLTESYLVMPTIDSRDYDQLVIEALSRTPVHNPEYLGFCSLDNTVPLHRLPSDFDLQQKLVLQDNYLYLQIKEESNGFAIQMVDVSDITNPTNITRYKHYIDLIYDYDIFENTMILAVNDTENIRLVNITDKLNPIDFESSYSVSYTNDCYLDVKDNFLFAYADTTITVFEITETPSLEFLYKLEIESIDHNTIRRVVFYNNYLLVISSRKISIYDIASPSNTTISEITPDGPGIMGFTFGLVDNNRLYVSMSSGIKENTLAIYDLTHISNPERLYPTEFTTTFPLKSATIISSLILIIGIIIRYRKKRKLLANY